MRQRPQGTTARLIAGQFRAAVTEEKPAIDVLSEQDKIRMQHYCPLHPYVVDASVLSLDDRADNELMFKQLSFERWLKQQKLPLVYGGYHFVSRDLRKFCEQMGDILQWEQSNRAYVMTHGVSGIDWKHYKHPLAENVYDVYMGYWKEVILDALEDVVV